MLGFLGSQRGHQVGPPASRRYQIRVSTPSPSLEFLAWMDQATSAKTVRFLEGGAGFYPAL